eukprot:TRINITY_DN39380_c0_g1_i1.p5 TRINITY_DN39380_c0_g1~~TRINITY_DN39380_c0_g1_i1.p5  ORF type:complete len:108 (+),score=11.33 TRINITY_DN39380_c0_g1_i1:1098-1421(+)
MSSTSPELQESMNSQMQVVRTVSCAATIPWNSKTSKTGKRRLVNTRREVIEDSTVFWKTAVEKLPWEDWVNQSMFKSFAPHDEFSYAVAWFDTVRFAKQFFMVVDVS